MENVEGKKDKSKLYENRSKISKNLLGKTGVLRDEQNNADIDVRLTKLLDFERNELYF